MLLKKVFYCLLFPIDVVLIFATTLNKKIDNDPPKGQKIFEKIKFRLKFSIKLAKYVGHDRIGLEYQDKEFDKTIDKYLNN